MSSLGSFVLLDVFLEQSLYLEQLTFYFSRREIMELNMCLACISVIFKVRWI